MQVDGYSLDAQRDKLRKYAAYEDMVVAGEYSDEGFSGKNIQGRQEFQRMLNDPFSMYFSFSAGLILTFLLNSIPKLNSVFKILTAPIKSVL